MTRTLEADVAIIGAGPVGLTLGLDLAWRGVRVAILELRHPGEPPSVKCNHVSARSMEIFRRLGIVRQIRDTGLPEDYPHDGVFRTTMVGRELARVPIPCRRDRYTSHEGPDTSWPTPEPPHRINQIFLEPVLFEHAASLPRVKILNRTSIDDFEQDADGVTAQARDLETGETFTIRAKYLVGCEGGKSMTRHKIGAKYEGPRAAIDRSAAGAKIVDVSLAQPAPPRHGGCDRRPRDVAHPQSS
jgi:2-polyprenyl-6-methoxyphenol hydroxylase-like FAD-dependent oxidoreductase